MVKANRDWLTRGYVVTNLAQGTDWRPSSRSLKKRRLVAQGFRPCRDWRRGSERILGSRAAPTTASRFAAGDVNAGGDGRIGVDTDGGDPDLSSEVAEAREGSRGVIIESVPASLDRRRHNECGLKALAASED